MIWSLYSDLSTLVAVTGLTRTAVAETVDPLIRLGFLTEEWEKLNGSRPSGTF